ncbi:MAG: hypothetical protein ACRC9O_09560 [Plesiomonas sp.]|uniref:hypothetical protein n=1 Tax=Plesiomonas sp. TaxID=2486279 RepID=UPI003F3B28C3
MSYLSLLLIAKIIVTALLVALPFLAAPLTKLEATTGLNAKNPLFFRLYGIAITALLVGYGFGIPTAENGQFPWGVACMGFVSNSGAAFLLLRTSKQRTSSFWLGSFFALVAVALAVSMGAPNLALGKAW